MPIRFDKDNQRWRFEFNRRIAGTRQRASRLLPKGWSRAKADKFDQTETARLYAVASGVTKPDDRLIDDAVLVYLTERGPALKNFKNLEAEFARCYPAYAGRSINELAAVAREYATASVGIIAPGTIKNRIADRFVPRAAAVAAHHRSTGCESVLRIPLPVAATPPK